MRKHIISIFVLVVLSYGQGQQDNIWNEAANAINVDPYLLWSIAKNESGFNPNSINFNKMQPTIRDEAIAYMNTLNIKVKSYGKQNQHLSIDCKSKRQAEIAIKYALEKRINFDIGIMNINSVHLKTLGKYNIDAYDLLEPELNIKVGAWELKGCIKRYGHSWDAINCYNGMSYENRILNEYASKIYNTMQRAKGSTGRFILAGQRKSKSEARYTAVGELGNRDYLAYEEISREAEN